MKKVWKIIDLIEERFMAFSLLLTVILVFLQVCMRAFGNSLPWSEELARYIFIWQCWLGVSFAEKDGKHIRIELLFNKLSPKGQKALDIIQILITSGIVIFLIVYGGYMVSFMTAQGTTSSILRVPLSLIYLSMPVSCALYLVRIISRLSYLITGRSLIS